MAELKEQFNTYGYADVVSYINSGNIIFSCDEQDEIMIANDIRLMINKEFELDISVLVIVQNEVQAILQNVPNCWGNDDKERYDNLIFVMPISTGGEIAKGWRTYC